MPEVKDYIKNIQDAERRFIENPVEITKRADSINDDIEEKAGGYAAKFNTRTKIGSWYEEEILPGAFDDVLENDVRCLKNHDPNLLLARTTSGTLVLSVDEVGLRYEFQIPDRTVGRDLSNELDTGDISQSSFAFTVKEEIWIEREDDIPLRQIKKMKRLYDVAPVTYPAYQDTSVAKRSHDAYVKEHNTTPAKAEESQNQNQSRAFDEFDAQYMFNQNNQ